MVDALRPGPQQTPHAARDTQGQPTPADLPSQDFNDRMGAIQQSLADALSASGVNKDRTTAILDKFSKEIRTAISGHTETVLKDGAETSKEHNPNAAAAVENQQRVQREYQVGKRSLGEAAAMNDAFRNNEALAKQRAAASRDSFSKAI